MFDGGGGHGTDGFNIGDEMPEFDASTGEGSAGSEAELAIEVFDRDTARGKDRAPVSWNRTGSNIFG